MDSSDDGGRGAALEPAVSLGRQSANVRAAAGAETESALVGVVAVSADDRTKTQKNSQWEADARRRPQHVLAAYIPTVVRA